ncbi:hypothetical protein BO82DRAFT_393627 [Aspergillus uvarum CBS 121591]|uniref:Uncharacterized protein n=1 Tax=Aspergillus uvarum CBS 121591 TaxID=1448315 RepID=A0A319C6P0_9EURO|nr:hypothetical protein BO82DRAFT_393627 [Aspergillus uvarum CBS 121591]PYH79680.1 hypothetical protein BO82DRAFT_393627 [Aspergillus uvarum CBS 121591]
MDLTDPAHNLGTFRTRPRTSRSGDQELPWKLIIPGVDDNDYDKQEQEQQQQQQPQPQPQPHSSPILKPTATTRTTGGSHASSTEWSARITGEVLSSIGKNSILVPPRPSSQQQQQQRSRSAPAPAPALAPDLDSDAVSPKSKNIPGVGQGQGQGHGHGQGGGRGREEGSSRTTTIPLLNPNLGPARPLPRRGGSTTDVAGGGGSGSGRTPSPLPPPPRAKIDLPGLPPGSSRTGSIASLMRGKEPDPKQQAEKASPSTEGAVATQPETPSRHESKHEDEEAEIVMFSTAYPGQEWRPVGFMEASGWGMSD